MDFIAHINDKGEKQAVLEHCKSTAELARGFSIPRLKQLNYAIALLHDIGKTTKSFQERIGGRAIWAPHAFYGAQQAEKFYGKESTLIRIAEYCIAGHHAGIPDAGIRLDSEDMPTLYAALSRSGESYCETWEKPELDFKALEHFVKSDCKTREDLSEKLAFVTRYCFSCLTDADSLDTEEFCTGKKRRSLRTDFGACLQKVDALLKSFNCETQLQKARGRVQQQVFEKAGADSEIYLMNMPTGSGKTLCSIKFALERAIATKKRRIIYIIPYNSIIDQTAETFERTFGDSAQILRHQSSFSYEDAEDKDEDFKTAAILSSENWDADLIITTAVQFFESVYGNKRGKLRKLHNMADSVLVFDEAHLMPEDYLQPCLRAITYITKYLGSEAVFLTATMADYRKLFSLYSLENTKILDLITDESDFTAFKKCSYKDIGKLSDEELIRRAAAFPSSLIVVNKKNAAKELYSLASGKKFHLSTYMASCDRQRVISDIKKELKRLYEDYPELTNVPDERRITVVSTSLIEAGVDLDFVSVFRELSGLDSILQSGGRCNREGLRQGAQVFIFERSAGKNSANSVRAEITRGIISEFPDIDCAESIRTYYDKLFFTKSEVIESHALKDYCERQQPLNIQFRSYSSDFRIIDSAALSIVVARDERSREFIEALSQGQKRSQREIQKYTLSVNNREMDELIRQGVVNDFGSGIHCLTNQDYYSPETGIAFEGRDYIFGEGR